MGFVVFPKYSNLYDGKVPRVEEVLQGIPSETIISLACHVNAQKHLNQFDPKVDVDIFRTMIVRLPKNEYDELGRRLKAFVKDTQVLGQDFSIFPLFQMLILIEHALVNFQEGPMKPISPVEEENILKAVLILNETLDDRHVGYGKLRTNDRFSQFITLIWPMMLATNEYTYRKEIVIPVYQSLLLFDFLIASEKFNPYVKSYLARNGVSTPTELLKHLVSCYLFSFNKEKQAFFTYYTKEDFEKNPVLFQFVRSIDGTTSALFSRETKARKLLREKPILKTGDDKYFITNWNFIIDKIYEGLKYDFFENSGVKEILKGGDEKEKWNSFTGTLNQEFSEKIIFLDVVNRLLNKEGITCIPETPSKKWNQDLYVRKSNHISFIEFKGAVLPVNEDFSTIKNDIEERMIFNKKDSKKKAAFQLIDQIVDFDKNINKFEDLQKEGLSNERLIIYPVIVYTDYNWGMAGVTDYVAEAFEKEISKSKLRFFSVEKLVMIHLDFLNAYERIFLDGQYSLHQVLYNTRHIQELYRYLLRFSNHPNDIINAYLDFGFYANRAYNNWWSPPHEISLFSEVMTKLGIPAQ